MSVDHVLDIAKTITTIKDKDAREWDVLHKNIVPNR